MSQRRLTNQQKGEFLAKFAASGMSAAAFCRRHGLPYQSFLRWQQTGAGGPAAAEPARFVEVELGPRHDAGAPGGRQPVAELELGAGVVLRVYPVQEEGRP